MGAIGFNTSGQLQINGTAINYGKNYIINGGFDIWQRGTSQTISGYGSDDRWDNNHIGSTKTHSKVTSTDTERALFNSPYFSRTVASSVAGAGNHIQKAQKIENVAKLAGKTVTISFWAKADANKNIAIELGQIFGIGGTPSEVVYGIGSQLVALTTTWQKKSITVTLPSIAGKTLGTDGVHTSFTRLNFWFDAGSSYNARTANLGQQSGTFDVAEVKLEEGSVATPWTPYEGEFGGEVQACQRYYEKIAAGHRWYSSVAASETILQALGFAVEKRVSPTLSFTDSGSANSVSSVANSSSSPTGHFLLRGSAIGAGFVYTGCIGSASAEL